MIAFGGEAKEGNCSEWRDGVSCMTSKMTGGFNAGVSSSLSEVTKDTETGDTAGDEDAWQQGQR
jgi:hypothetical protein